MTSGSRQRVFGRNADMLLFLTEHAATGEKLAAVIAKDGGTSLRSMTVAPSHGQFPWIPD